MKKLIYLLTCAALMTGEAYSQSAIDAYRLSQPDLKGTARYMSMAGAFGALGGDLSAISQNPGGIGVYRNGDIGFTLDLDCQSSSSESQGMKYDMSQTKFLLNNIGAVLTLRLPSQSCPNLNFGFTYNKGVSFNRKYGGNIPRLYNSMSNYIAGIANAYNLSEGDVASSSTYDAYANYNVPWFPILGYDGYLITPYESKGETNWYGQWGEGTQGSGAFLVNESGAVNEYNITLGGNISNVVFWGMNFDIVNLDYSMNAIWGEDLIDAFVPDNNNKLVQESAQWNLNNIYNVNGTGFNYQLGIIVKPIQELRLGFAFHTPTWYNLTETYGANIGYLYGQSESGNVQTNGGILGYNDVNFRTPWKFIASIAGVIGSNFILSLDYEWTSYNKMKYSKASSNGGFDYGWGWDDPWYGWDYMSSNTKASSSGNSFLEASDPYYATNSDISTYYQTTNTLRIGAEYRINPAFSIRAGYCNVSSPVKSEAKSGAMEIYTSGTLPNYRFDNSTNYITCGAGWKYQHFYVDLAYVYKHMSSMYHAYTPDLEAEFPSPQSKISLTNNQIILTAGFRF